MVTDPRAILCLNMDVIAGDADSATTLVARGLPVDFNFIGRHIDFRFRWLRG